ncbi:glucose 1-dehydrogenase [Bosea sp. NPDC055594]
MRGLEGKRAIVTGGSGGIGREICRRFGAEGTEVVIFDLDPAGGQETARMVVEAGGRASAHRVDISDRAAVDAALKQVEAQGAVDILVNNAGWDRPIPFLETDAEFWKKVIDINLYGPLNMHHAVLPGMIANGGGCIVNVSSDAGRVGSSGEAVYSACKGGVIAFSKTIARELARKNIRVNTVCPGPTDTNLLAEFRSGDAGDKILEGMKRAIPMRRIGQPCDYPGIVCFLASDDAAFILGQTISVSGGLTMHG